ncbi:ABC transporter substrate-binding protein [Paracoccus sp. (in: a-proteobacteria)]|uniref:ABC transporter substrate-binding protein n=1 Tax=Paracoccus sp. TaxID=267 RepID=UPI002AFFFE69|nr:ABC transporter substrate-binding protein [Paracoccus sp. (in: a-proteobacteria)]
MKLGMFCHLLPAAALSLGLVGQSAAGTVKVGVITPLTGAGAPWGMAAREAGEILAERINKAGGLEVGGEKHQVEIIAYDDQYKAAEAVAAYNRLVNQDGVKFVVISTSASTMALKQQLEDDQIVALTTANTGAAIDEDTKFLFRLFSTTREFMPAYARWIADNYPDRRIVSLNPNDETGWDQVGVTTPAYKEAGFEVLAEENYERAAKDFMPLLTKVIGLNPEIIDLGTSSPATAGLIVRQARELGYQGKFIQTGGAGWQSVVDTAGKEAGDGLINVLYADPDDPEYQALTAAYRAEIGQDPNEIIVSYYDGFNVLLEAIRKSGTIDDAAKVAESMPQVLPMQSLQGDEITWKHQQLHTYDYIGVLTDGRPVVKDKIK